MHGLGSTWNRVNSRTTMCAFLLRHSGRPFGPKCAMPWLLLAIFLRTSYVLLVLCITTAVMQYPCCTFLSGYNSVMQETLPVFGQVARASWTCPGCGEFQQSPKLSQKQGIHTCHTCHTPVRVGLALYLLPRGRFTRTIIPPDYAIPRAEALKQNVRARPRTGRLRALRELGINPNAVSVAQAVPGAPVNTVTVVHDPASESAA